MAAATEPQAVPVVSDMTAWIVTFLDSALALQGAHPSFALLPTVTDFRLIDLSIRLWASVHPGVRIREWGQWSRRPSGDDPGLWIEGIALDGPRWPLLTLHTPEELRVRRPEVMS